MKRFKIAIPAVALILAACGTAAGSSGTSTTNGSVNSGYVQVNSAQSAGTDAQGNPDVNNVNLPPKKPGSQVITSKMSSPATVAPAPTPAFGVAQDRCSAGIAGSGGGNGAAVSSGKRPQLPACMPQ